MAFENLYGKLYKEISKPINASEEVRLVFK